MKRVLRLLALAAALSLPFAPARAIIDLNSDGVDDIWALKYNAGALSPTADTDGDGINNHDESVMGTDPFKPDSSVKVKAITVDGGGVHLTFPTQIGKRYQVQNNTSLAPAGWANLGAPIAGTDLDYVATLSAPGAQQYFYRVLIGDNDADGDGVNDWDEVQLGFDPNNSHSHGPAGADDLTAVTQGLQAPNVVSVKAGASTVTEPPVGNVSTGVATFVVTRSGGFGKITANYTVSGSATPGTDYTPLTGSVTLGLGVNTATLTVTPLADSAVESPEAVIVTIAAGVGYSFALPAPAAGVLIYDFATPNGDGALARYWNSTAGTINNYNTAFPATAAVITRVESVINNLWAAGVSPGGGVNEDNFVSRYTADILPEFSQIYTFTGVVNTAGRLTVNGKIVFDNWGGSSSTLSGTVEMQAGIRVPIVFEHMERSGDAQATLSWSSANLPLEIIPQVRLFSNAPPQILSPLDLFYIKDAPASPYQILASGSPTGYSAVNLPTGWTLNTSTGAITVTTATAGEWDTIITATNANGSGSAILHVEILAAGGVITRDEWSPVAGTSVSDIPLATNPTSTGNITSLEGPQNLAPAYGARIRGYVTAPTTGVYKFFLTASDAAELYISDDEEVVNAFKRAQVTAATGFRDWTHVNAAKSPLLYLTVGHRYYVEVRHKAGAGNDHVSVGWMQPGQGGIDPGAYVPVSGTNVVVPAYVLSPYVPPAPISGESTLYSANLTSQGAAVTNGYGSATITLSADETQAIVHYTYANLTGGVTSKHVHSDAFASHPQGEIIFDIDAATPEQDGSYVWDLVPVGTFTTRQQIVDAIKGGTSYLNVHTAAYPAGEVRGNLRLAAASQTFTPPPLQTWTDPENSANVDSHLNRNGATRFLAQATFGASGVDVAPADGNPDDIAQVQALGFSGWIDSQFALPTTYHFPYVFANRNQTSGNNGTYSQAMLFSSWWKNSVQAPDQLRQRLAFALSEILVTSEAGPLDEQADALSDYYDMLLAGSFGNFKDLLINTTLHPAMGRYLDMLGNDKPNLSTGKIPNENYAREIKQLFSIGLNRLHPDGSLILNSKGELIPTYDQDAIIGFAHVFTGWYYNSAVVNPYPTSFNAGVNWLLPMTPVPAHHFTGQKRVLDNVVFPGLATVGGQPLDPYASHSSAQINDPAYQGLPAAELNSSHDQLFQHPNTGPFICRQLIQRFVTGTPSRGYLYRVVQKFADNGSGVRGDLKAVIKAILLDYEARSSVAATMAGFGKQREPVSRVTAIARAFPAPAPVTGTYAQVGSLINVTTSAPHLYTGTPQVVLHFDPATDGDAGQPTDAAYPILASPAVTATTFSVRSKSFVGGIPYTQANGITTFNNGTNTDFYFTTGQSIYAEYLTGSPTVPSGVDSVEFRSSDTYTVILANPTTRRGTYSQSAGSTTMTVSILGHGYAAASTIHLEAVTGSPLPAVGIYTIGTVAANSFTVTTADTPASARNGTIFSTPPGSLVPAKSGNANLCYATDFANRSGPMSVGYSDWNMNETPTELNQTPMQSPTVFNFFLPDYQFPGVLSNAGLITPEFQLTSETSVIRQANTIFSGIFNDSLGQLGLSSFKGGSRDIIFDLRPWMGTGPGGVAWVHNNNLDALLDELNTRLMSGKLSSTGTNDYASNPRVIVNAKQAIKDYVQTLPLTRAVTNTSAAAITTLTVTNHGLSTIAGVTIAGVAGGTFSPSINAAFTATITGPNTMTIPVTCTNLAGLNLASATITPNGGSAMPIAGVNGNTTVSVSAHGLVAGQSVTISGVTGGTFSPSINGTFTLVTNTTNSFTVPVTRTNGTGVNYSNAAASFGIGFPDLLRDRARAVVHLLVTSPDFTIQK